MWNFSRNPLDYNLIFYNSFGIIKNRLIRLFLSFFYFQKDFIIFKLKNYYFSFFINFSLFLIDLLKNKILIN